MVSIERIINYLKQIVRKRQKLYPTREEAIVAGAKDFLNGGVDRQNVINLPKPTVDAGEGELRQKEE